MNQNKYQSLTQINQRAADLATNIKLLGSLSWPRSLESQFLAALSTGAPLPTVAYPKPDYGSVVEELSRLRDSFTAVDPLEVFTKETIQSYINAAEMVQATGTERLTELSTETFGRPGSLIPGMRLTNIEAAQQLIALGHNFEHPFVSEPAHSLTAEQVAARLRLDIEEHFSSKVTSEPPPQVLVVSELAAKASATASVIKLREGAAFSRYDSKQLFAHEVMVHSLTALNGENQPILKTLGRGAPRTTATQEGLATFSELVSGAIDLKRLLRLALRILAIDRALSGANFRETFEFFVNHGQSQEESYSSAARIFRGGQPDQNIIFTKDSVYLDGLFRVHTLFRWALANRRLGLVHLLFCGRLTIEDCFALEGAYDSGLVAAPVHVPDWYLNIEALAGQLTFSLVLGAIHSQEVEAFFTAQSRQIRP